MAEIYRNEKAFVEKWSRRGTAAIVAGGCLALFSLLAAMHSYGNDAAWAIGVAAIGGMLVAAGGIWRSSVNEVHALRKYLNPEAIEDAMRNEQL